MNMIPRARLIYTSIWSSEQVANLKHPERNLYIGMITIADDDGRFKADERFLNAQIFPYDNISAKKVAEMRDHIHLIGLIFVYQVENTLYALHPKWTRFQKLRSDRTKPSEIPTPLVANTQPSDNRPTTEVNESEVISPQENISGTPQQTFSMQDTRKVWEETSRKIRDGTYDS